MLRKYKIFILIVINLLLLKIVDMFTIHYGLGGGNGNPAIIPIAILIPFAIWNAVILYQWFIKLKISTIFKIVIIASASTYLIIGTKIQIEYYNNISVNLRNALSNLGIPIDENFIHNSTSGLTMFTNWAYFSYNTFFMFLTLTILLSILISSIKKH